jgi:UPF0755 protein
MTVRRWLSMSIVVVLVLAVIAGGLLGWLFYAFDRPGPLTKPVAVVIPKNLSVDDIGRLLEAKNVVADAHVFALGTRLTGNASALQPGEYQFGIAFTPRSAMNLIKSGQRVAHKLTVPECLTTVQVLKVIHDTDGLDGAITITPPEGALLPETYQYFWGDSRDSMIARMTAARDNALAELWEERPKDTVLKSPEEAVVLASIIAREAGDAKERPIIASVMVNRLKRGMPLESDVTVAYGAAIAEHAPGEVLTRTLTRTDLKRPGPYNSYLNKGLPPTPICNPARETIRAALHPSKTNYLFFSAGTNGNVFARTAREHASNVEQMKAAQAFDTATTPAENEAKAPATPPGR